MMVRGEAYIITLKMSHIIPTNNDLFLVPCNVKRVIRATIPKKRTSIARQIPTFF